MIPASEDVLNRVADELVREMTGHEKERHIIMTGNLSVIDDAISAIRRKAIAQVLGVRREANLRAPINQLPTEVFANILLMICQDYSARRHDVWYYFLCGLSRVSTRWKSVVDSTAFLWRRIHWSLPYPLAAAILRKSRDLPLDVAIRMASWSPDPTWQCIIHQAHRWESAEIVYENPDMMRALEALNVPLLKRLSVEPDDQNRLWAPQQLFNRLPLPNLRFLDLPGLHDTFDPTVIAFITDLTLGSASSPCHISPKCLLGILNGCLQLQSLSVSCPDPSPPTLPLDATLPRLLCCRNVDVFAPSDICVPVLLSLGSSFDTLVVRAPLGDEEPSEWDSRLVEGLRNVERGIECILTQESTMQLSLRLEEGFLEIMDDIRSYRNLHLAFDVELEGPTSWLKNILSRAPDVDVLLYLATPAEQILADCANVTTIVLCYPYSNVEAFINRLSEPHSNIWVFPGLKTLSMVAVDMWEGSLETLLRMLKARAGDGPQKWASHPDRITEVRLNHRWKEEDAALRMQQYLQTGQDSEMS